MQALQIHAGPMALRHLREHGLRPADVAMVPGAAGGPKGLVLNPLDRFLFGDWLSGAAHTVHLAGASIGAWRLASACLPDADAALAEMAHHYIHETYDDGSGSGRNPTPEQVSRVFETRLAAHFGGREQAVLSHPRYRLHVFTSRGVHPLLSREQRLRTALGYAGAFAANLRSRRAMARWLERVIFSDCRDPLPLPAQDYRTQRVCLDPRNLRAAILASCSIPFWLRAVADIPGAPAGAYWDGGITDYHLHLEYASLLASRADGGGQPSLVLYPHFQPTVIPGWLDKGLRRRHRATPALANVVLLAPNPEWIRTLPNGKLPDRRDFRHYGRDHAGRAAAWTCALAQSARLADEFADLVSQRNGIEALPLA